MHVFSVIAKIMGVFLFTQGNINQAGAGLIVFKNGFCQFFLQIGSPVSQTGGSEFDRCGHLLGTEGLIKDVFFNGKSHIQQIYSLTNIRTEGREIPASVSLLNRSVDS